MIHVIATIWAKDGRREELLAAFHDLLPQVRAEEGCVAYGPAVDVPTGLDVQQPPDDQTLTIIEQWRSVEHLKAHLDASHMHAFREKAGGLIESLSIRVLEPAS